MVFLSFKMIVECYTPFITDDRGYKVIVIQNFVSWPRNRNDCLFCEFQENLYKLHDFRLSLQCLEKRTRSFHNRESNQNHPFTSFWQWSVKQRRRDFHYFLKGGGYYFLDSCNCNRVISIVGPMIRCRLYPVSHHSL